MKNITRPVGTEWIVRSLEPLGLRFDAVLVTPDDDISFNRRSLTPGRLAENFSIVAGRLNSVGIALPKAYKVDGETAVSLAVGHGIACNDTNPNPSGTGLVQQIDQIGRRLALGVPFADAPAALVVHTRTGLMAACSGLAQMLGRGTIWQTIALMREQVERKMRFDRDDIRVILSPGARGYKVDGRMVSHELAAIDPSILNSVMSLNASGDDSKPHILDLSLLFHRLWKLEVPASRIYFDQRDTLSDGSLPSKQRADARGEQYRSGILAGIVTLV